MIRRLLDFYVDRQGHRTRCCAIGMESTLGNKFREKTRPRRQLQDLLDQGWRRFC
jgi:hypothetical protein